MVPGQPGEREKGQDGGIAEGFVHVRGHREQDFAQHIPRQAEGMVLQAQRLRDLPCGGGFIMGLKVHFADFGKVTGLGPDTGGLRGPIYIFSLGGAIGN